MTDRDTARAAGRYDPWWVAGLALLLLAALTPGTGIWEPWEADRAQIVEYMRANGLWLQVARPGAKGVQAIAELPFGWWPLIGSTSIFGMNEIGLRLPSVLLGVLTVWLTFRVTRPLFGRLAAWGAALGLLTMPLFALHARLVLGGGIGVGLVGLTGLAFLVLGTRPAVSRLWQWGAWLGLAACGLTEGAWGLATVGLTAAAAAILRQRQAGGRAWQQVAPPAAVAVAVALIGVGWWRAAAHLAEDLDLRALLLWADGIEPAVAAKRPFFNHFTHQLGFGLFPLGAFVPLALADLLWRPTAGDEAPSAAPAATLLAVWFAVGFLAPAVGQPFGQWGVFLGAPAVAIAIGVYFARALREPPQPLLALAAVLLLALLDSNLKHETQSLADVLVGQKVDAFPAKLPGWGIARLLDMALLGTLILFQGGLIRWLRPAARWIAYPTEPIRLLTVGPSRTWLSLLAGLGAAAAVMLRKPDWLERLLIQRFWGRMLPEARVFLVALVLLVAIHLAVWGVWNLRRRRLDGSTTGHLDAGIGRLLDGLNTRAGRVALLLGVLGAWGGFLNGVAARVLTQNFSQKDLLSAYERYAVGDEPLVTYQMDANSSSFYTQQLEALDRKAFAAQVKGDGRLFALVPRKQLARINGEFRAATGETLPVLDDRSQRFLLVSNQLKDGETDRNPIKRALVETLPPGTERVTHTFDDQVQLVGWRLEPKEPRPGSPVKIHLYWKALKKISGTWKVFVHIDAPGQRIHGDHDPVEGLYPTGDWAVGDIVHDEHQVVVKRTNQSGWYTFYLGLYRGSTRMKVTVGAKDKENRAKVGRVKVR